MKIPLLWIVALWSTLSPMYGEYKRLKILTRLGTASLPKNSDATTCWTRFRVSFHRRPRMWMRTTIPSDFLYFSTIVSANNPFWTGIPYQHCCIYRLQNKNNKTTFLQTLWLWLWLLFYFIFFFLSTRKYIHNNENIVSSTRFINRLGFSLY